MDMIKRRYRVKHEGYSIPRLATVWVRAPPSAPAPSALDVAVMIASMTMMAMTMMVMLATIAHIAVRVRGV
eukprot:SAG25_NODE_1475_length_2947_cov_2.597612_3_plen_71_part_00